MKICACIAEYNPLHLGHVKHINYMKNVLGAEKIIVIMSGNFCQRGECAVLNKFVRAKQAIFAGADMVIELPTVFAIGNAETFATGAINLIDDLGCVDGICFGVESGEKEDYLKIAKSLINESKEYKSALKKHLEKGVSLAKAKCLALEETEGENFASILSSPNGVLGVEYAKALLKRKSSIEIFPLIREGDHNDKVLKKGITSASSIREKIKAGEIKKVKGNVPPFVYKELVPYPFGFEKMIMTKLLTESEETLKKLPDCTEGLENRLKALSKENLTVEGLVAKATTKRYPSSRIRRILISNLLGITENLRNDCLSKPLYAKVLAISSDSKELISLLSKKSSIPVITRKSDGERLTKTAKLCFEKDSLAVELYNLATDDKQNEHYMLII